jgi:hypothetical protein
MNNIGKLVKQYNKFVEDLGSLNSAVYELLTNEFRLAFVKEYWSPRDRSAWSSKERYCGWYTTNKTVLYVCFNLITDIPYLQFLKCDVNLKKCKPEEFGIDDGFDHVENEDIKKVGLSDYFMSFEQDWGKCCYCKIDLSTIGSDEIVNRDIKKVLGCMLKNDYSVNDFNNLKFL